MLDLAQETIVDTCIRPVGPALTCQKDLNQYFLTWSTQEMHRVPIKKKRHVGARKLIKTNREGEKTWYDL